MSLGGATMTETSGTLYVTNLGSGGQDGVSFSFPAGLTQWSAYWSDPDASDTLPDDGTWMVANVMGSYGAVSNGILGALTSFKAGTSNYFLSADWSFISVTNFTAMVSDGTNVVGQLVGVSNSIAAALPSIGTSFHVFWNPFRVVIDFPVGPVTMDPDGAALKVTGNTCTIIPTGANPAPSGLQLLTAGIPGLAIQEETAAPLVLKSTTVGRNLSLQWFGSGVLQQSTDLHTWSDITNSSSPYPVITTSGRKFYRIREPVPGE